MRFYSPLRYPGGKGKLVPFLRALINENNLSGCVYLEPYAGGASAALALLMDGIVSQVYINDISYPIYAFWKAILHESENFCRMVQDCEISPRVWEEQKRILSRADKHTFLETGFAAFFLNRTNYSGVISGGLIGGKSQNGTFKMDARFPKSRLIERITCIAEKREYIHLSNQDAKVFLETVLPQIEGQCMVYLDPPYYRKGKSLYLNFYEHVDHLEMCQVLRGLKDTFWLVSYDDVEEIRQIYRSFTPIPYSLRYNANKRYLGREVLFCSPLVKVPS